MKNQFARIFESEQLGQILVRKDSDDEGHPSVIVTIDYQDALVSLGQTFAKDEEAVAFEKRENFFNSINQEMAEKLGEAIKKQIDAMLAKECQCEGCGKCEE